MADRYVETQAGTFFHGEQGEDIKAIERNLPGANFPESVRMFLRLIGLPLGLPLELILLDFSQTNYAAARAAWSQAWASFTKWQVALKKRHNTPIYERWLRWRIASGENPKVYRDEPAMFRHKWDLPTFPWWNPKDEAEAWGAKIDHGFATQTDALASQGVDQQDYLRRRAAEIEAAMKTADEINARNPDAPPVHWRELVGSPVSKNDTYTQQTQPAAAKVQP
jgi:capsid protein